MRACCGVLCVSVRVCVFQLVSVDVGVAEPLSVVTGVAAVYRVEELQDRLVVLLCNTKPRNVGGARSFGLILAATSSDGAAVELLDPPASAVVGERVAFPPLQALPATTLPLPPLVATKAKLEVLDVVLPLLHVDQAGVATFSSAEVAMTTSAGPVTVKSLRQAQIK